MDALTPEQLDAAELTISEAISDYEKQLKLVANNPGYNTENKLILTDYFEGQAALLRGTKKVLAGIVSQPLVGHDDPWAKN